MGIQNWSESVVLVNLEREPSLSEDLESVIATVMKRGNCHVVVDFANVDIITSSNIAKLLKLRKSLVDNNHCLLFSSVSPQLWKVFEVTGLDKVFDFYADQFVALAGLQMVSH